MEIAEFTGTFMQEEFKPGIRLRLGKDEEYAYWRVLDINKEQETALLMAERSLRVKPYHNEHRAITWENCSLRAWLNDEYYEKTFSEKEKAAIIETPHEFLSRDKVFLLSTSEAKDYLSDEHDRTARYYSGWLRSPGSYSDNAACIDNNGSINYLGCNVVCLKTFCPAICIDLNSDLFRSLVLSDSSDAIIIRTPELLIKDGQVISANPGVKDVEVPFGVSVIKKNAFMNCMRLTSVKIPESVTRIEPCSFQGSNELVIASIPEKVSIVGSFDYCKKLDVVMICNGAKRRVLAFAQNSTGRTNLDDYGKSDFWQRYDLEIINNGPQYKFRSPARLLAAAGRLSDPIGMSNASREAYIAMLKGNEKKVITFAKKYDIPEAVQALLENGLVQEENLKTLRKLLAGSQNLHIAELATAKLKLEESTEKRQISSIDMEYGEKFEKAGGDKALREMRLAGIAFPEVLLRNGEKAPESLLKYILISYGKLADSGTAQFDVGADKAADLLTYDSVNNAVEQLSDQLDVVSYPSLIPMICRFGNASQIRALLKKQKNWYDGKEKTAKKLLKDFLTLSDTHEAVNWLEKNEGLSLYAELRGIREIEVYDKYLFNFGFDDAGKKLYDLGITKIEVAIDRNLSISLRDTEKGKLVRGIPKKNIDPTLRKEAEDDLSDLRNSLKKAVKIKIDQLFDDYIRGRWIPYRQWEKSYQGNPVLHTIAELMVWEQSGHFFTLFGSTAVDSEGATYEIKNDPLRVAHPMEMKDDERFAWQKYFVSHGIRQPFAQIWDPVYEKREIRPDRYVDCPITVFYLKNQEKRGIHIQWWENYYAVKKNLGITGFNVKARDYYDGKDADGNKKIEITSLEPLEWSRRTNTVIAFLDRITVWDRVKKDDLSVMIQMDRFTVAQITDLIKLAQENNAVNVLAQLMEYKNKHYAEFDPMDEFTLHLI